MKKYLFLIILCAIILSLAPLLSPYASYASGGKYPSKNIEMYCGFSAGGMIDTITRTLAKGLEKQLGVSVVTINKPGGGEVHAAAALAQSNPDGYTMAVLGDAGLTTAFLLKRANYKFEDLHIIGQFCNIFDVWVVKADSPWKSIYEFNDYAKKNPGVPYAHPGVGASTWVKAELFNSVGKLNLRGVPFKGDPETFAALLGNHVSILVGSYIAAKNQVDLGKVRIVFCFDPSKKFLPEIPNMPTVFGPNVPDIEPVAIHLVLPAKVPTDTIRFLESTLEKVTKDPEFIETMNKLYLMVRFIDGKTVTEKTLPEKTRQIKIILDQAGLIK